MIVEDEPALLEVISSVLSMEGFEPFGVERPEMATSVAERAKPELFLIDIMLPGASGIEVAQDLREHGFTRAPMIAMSASRSMLEAAARSKLFSTELAKPFDFDDLVASIRGIIEGKSQSA